MTCETKKDLLEQEAIRELLVGLKKKQAPSSPPSSDPVSHPDHYQSTKGFECIDAIEAATEDLRGFEGMLTGNAIKYLWRWKKKAKPTEDIRKAIWYMEKLVAYLESHVEKGGCQ